MKPTPYSSDVSFLLGLANKDCADVGAGPISKEITPTPLIRL